MIKATSYNKGSFNVDFNGSLGFVKLEDLYKQDPEAEYQITGMFINKKSKYGAKPFLSTPDFFVDLPSHKLELIQEMINDRELVNEINSGIVGFKVRTYQSSTYNKDCYDIVFTELK